LSFFLFYCKQFMANNKNDRDEIERLRKQVEKITLEKEKERQEKEEKERQLKEAQKQLQEAIDGTGNVTPLIIFLS